MVPLASIRDVAVYILTRCGEMTTMKLQKLCYYAYGYHLAWEERALFDEPFEAWANGPVSPALYDRHRGRFRLNQSDLHRIGGNPDKLDPWEIESIDLVLAGLGDLTAHQLSTMSHREAPWLHARERANVGSLERSSEELHVDEIYEYFDAVTSTDADGQG